MNKKITRWFISVVLSISSVSAVSLLTAAPSYAAAVNVKAVATMSSASAKNALPTAAAIQVSWNSVPNALAYVVTLSAASTQVGSQTISSTVGATSYQATFSGLTGGVTYSAVIKSQGDATDNFSISDAATLVAQSIPDKPGIVSATAKKESIDLVWTAPTSTGGSAITTYTISADNLATPVTVSAPATSKTVTGLTAGTPYTFKIVANNANGASQTSLFDKTTVLSAPAAPTITTDPTIAGTTLTTAWNAPSDNGGDSTGFGYLVTLYKDGVAYGDVASTPLTTYDFSLTESGSYTFKVAAKNNTGTGVQSAASNAVTYTAPVVVTVPGAPSAPTATLTSSTLALSWAAPSNTGGATISGYTLKLYKDGTLLSTDADVTYTSKNFTLSNSGSYTATVAAKNSAGYGAYSSASIAVTYTVPTTSSTSSGGVVQTPTPTSTPTPTPTPTATASATPTPTPSATVKPTPTPTASATPASPPTPIPSAPSSATNLPPSNILGVFSSTKKPAVSVVLSSNPKTTVQTTTLNKTLSVTIPGVKKGTIVTTLITLPNGSSYKLASITQVQNGQLSTPVLKFAKPGTYIMTIKVGTTTKKVKVVVTK